MSLSPAGILARLPESERVEFWESLDPDTRRRLAWDWKFWGRPEQHAPEGDWRTWLLLAGRGFGKSRAGAEWINAQAIAEPDRRLALLGRTAADVRDVMVSSLLGVGDPEKRPLYEPSKRRVTWPNGSFGICFSAEEPDQMRGPQYHVAWIDELAAFQYTDAWDQLQLGLRLGDHPRCVVTTTPRPTKLIRSLLSDPSTAVTRGTTFDNEDNIAIDAIVKKYGGTTLGRQELYAEILDDAPGALWNRSDIDRFRVNTSPNLRRIVIGVDPAVTSGADSDETGIIAVGADGKGDFFVLADRTCRASPDKWARAAVNLYHELQADAIVAEVNQGGDMVEHTIKTVDKSVHVRKIRASRGKAVRAEPIAALSEQGRVHFVGVFAGLEDELVTWQAGVDSRSPDRLDAFVHATSDLLASTPLRGLKILGSSNPNPAVGV